ncbi:MucR family transcriptional regulator [Tabrizicola sp. TH137]|uniref:MucR family transcriptional regulator n=1 Tax=Tabrizicola sp. TH137 TaxID=2067452 RepID=UPI000C7C5149|nr:MucR family transcriptional regulator [Tabrizicola sp. TH137]PLL10246.1 MucR family transcriptional regulator [Tabrizicola sp. TH137]
MKTDLQFLKSTVQCVVNQQLSQRNLSALAVADLTVDLVLSLMSANTDEQPRPSSAVGIQQLTCPRGARFIPAVAVEESVQDEYLVCLEDGLRFRMLKRHLAETYGMTPDEYRRKWGLDSDYPMTAPAYSRRRGEIARSLKLGHYPRR